MPQGFSSWIDTCIYLTVILCLMLIILVYNKYFAFMGFILLVALFFYGRDRYRERKKIFDNYVECVAKNINELSNYAIDKFPIAIAVINSAGNVQWTNNEFNSWFEGKVEYDCNISEVIADLPLDKMWAKDGEFVLLSNERYFNIKHRLLVTPGEPKGLLVLYVSDVTAFEMLKQDYLLEMPALAYVQIDNYDDVLQGLTDSQRTDVIVEVNKLLEGWAGDVGAFIKKISEDSYITVLNRKSLNKVINDKFDVLDKVKAVHGANRYPVTLSMGVAVGAVNMIDLGEIAQTGLDLALGRGGDQVVLDNEGARQFYGGKAKAVEKHTRVKARVVAHALYETILNADFVLIMSHQNEDFDSLGAAMGVAKMARHLNKKAYIAVSAFNVSVNRLMEMTADYAEYDNLFVDRTDAIALAAANPVLFVVDTHIPEMTAVPELLNKSDNIIVIDHHRRSENFINKALLVYLEPSASSTAELVTELLMYFSENIDLTRIEATGLYAGIVVDTKNFAVQTGVRTFDAAAYLRRAGADPGIVKMLFREDYAETVIRAEAIAKAEALPNGIIITMCKKPVKNIQVTAAQVADALLKIDKVKMSLVLFQLEDAVGISARSNGEVNVQIIMEEFGGGGHQTVAGAQVKEINIEELRCKVLDISTKYIEESEEDESNSTTRS